jgi:hypothetical protein
MQTELRYSTTDAFMSRIFQEVFNDLGFRTEVITKMPKTRSRDHHNREQPLFLFLMSAKPKLPRKSKSIPPVQRALLGG